MESLHTDARDCSGLNRDVLYHDSAMEQFHSDVFV